jgi:hypothetical protein
MWIKPMGVTQPELRPMPNEWLRDTDPREPYTTITGPKSRRQPPAVARDDLVLLHGVHYVRLFAEARVISHPRDNTSEPGYRDRWPWELDLELLAWVDQIEEGAPSRDVLPARAFRRIQVGAPYADVSQQEFEIARAALRALPSCRFRESSR